MNNHFVNSDLVNQLVSFEVRVPAMKRILLMTVLFSLTVLLIILDIDSLHFKSEVEFVFEYLSLVVIIAIAISGFTAFKYEPLAIGGMTMFILQATYRMFAEIEFLDNQFDRLARANSCIA
ncbi:hypothetical protein BIT28_12895 [Photobacterium proteolyticum]|uniref:Uncharacterized protein n=1 Tax=Photobacterium proteolyticum TaxID=1903952 RepID=A0A1Q9GK31_9GAMM|nr:hypothetical protein [Photobacterium proteolyticum]OLQ74854.1 hypothetical protein BIT28_12895 [Photobacterium proteolyticum]